MSAHFSSGLFNFLRELAAHNTREWFEAHRDRYERHVQQPMLHFIDDLRPRLARVAPGFVADPRKSGGSMFRIYRDTRFSADKSPYKTHVAARFLHRDQPKGQQGPSFYLHLEPGEAFGGGGIYHPDMPTLTRVRHAIVDDARGWRAVRKAGLEIEGESLKRAPAGFDPAHTFAEDLRRKDHYAIVPFTDAEVVSPSFLDRYVEACATVAPLVTFLSRALGLAGRS
jgi:uncharacterized protein (TIGR02453 family)